MAGGHRFRRTLDAPITSDSSALPCSPFARGVARRHLRQTLRTCPEDDRLLRQRRCCAEGRTSHLRIESGTSFGSCLSCCHCLGCMRPLGHYRNSQPQRMQPPPGMRGLIWKTASILYCSKTGADTTPPPSVHTSTLRPRGVTAASHRLRLEAGTEPVAEDDQRVDDEDHLRVARLLLGPFEEVAYLRPILAEVHRVGVCRGPSAVGMLLLFEDIVQSVFAHCLVLSCRKTDARSRFRLLHLPLEEPQEELQPA